MRVDSIRTCRTIADNYKTMRTFADIEVPGLGKITIENCLSDSVIEQMEAEIIMALSIKLGQTIKIPKAIDC